jgi:23S rRNA (guanosine2251-2'-O)-methyltransferase
MKPAHKNRSSRSDRPFPQKASRPKWADAKKGERKRPEGEGADSRKPDREKAEGGEKREYRGGFKKRSFGGAPRDGEGRSEGRSEGRGDRPDFKKRDFKKRDFKRPDRGDRPDFRKPDGERAEGGEKREYRGGFKKRSFGGAPRDGEGRSENRGDRPDFKKRDFKKRDFKRSDRGDRPDFKKPDGERSEGGEKREYSGGFKKRSFGAAPRDGEGRSERRNEGRGDRRDFGKRDFRKRDTDHRRPERKSFGKKPENSSENADRAPKPIAATKGQVLFGFHAVAAAWLNAKRKALRLFLTPSGQKTFEATLLQAEKAGLERPKPEIVEAKALDRLTSNAVHQGIALDAAPLADVELEDILQMDPLPRCLLMLDQVTDPHNVGAILRTACAFGVGGVLMTDRHAAGGTGTLAKIASGALEHTPLIRVPNLAQAMTRLQKENYWCIGLDEAGTSALHDIKMPEKVVLVLGAEGEGLRRLTRESCDEIAKLPTQPPIGSLNVSNAAAVAIYEVSKNRQA